MMRFFKKNLGAAVLNMFSILGQPLYNDCYFFIIATIFVV